MRPLADGTKGMPDRHRLAQFDELMAAINRLNVDWDDLARTCGDPRCGGDCKHVAAVREVLALNGYGAFQ